MTQVIFSQSGGKSTYEFLAIPTSARATALGGSYNNIYDGDAGLAISNPAMLQPAMHKNMSLSYSPYIAKTNYANLNYVHDLKLATFQFGTVYMNYGKQEEYDEFLDLFIKAVKRRWPSVLLQFEDFAQPNAMPLLKRYRNEICSQ